MVVSEKRKISSLPGVCLIMPYRQSSVAGLLFGGVSRDLYDLKYRSPGLVVLLITRLARNSGVRMHASAPQPVLLWLLLDVSRLLVIWS